VLGVGVVVEQQLLSRSLVDRLAPRSAQLPL